MKTGVSTSTVFSPKTGKQRADAKARKKANAIQAKKNKKMFNKLCGTLIYQCSSCVNKVRMHEDLGDRKVMCSKCNNGFFTRK
ncbi:hypothetical protein [Paenibacillus chitinolyticus]